MSWGAFWFIIVLLAAGFLVVFVEWLYRRFESTPDEDSIRQHQLLMKEIRKYDRDGKSSHDKGGFSG